MVACVGAVAGCCEGCREAVLPVCDAVWNLLASCCRSCCAEPVVCCAALVQLGRDLTRKLLELCRVGLRKTIEFLKNCPACDRLAVPLELALEVLRT